MESFMIPVKQGQRFAAEKQVGSEWKLTEEGILYTGPEIVVGHRILVLNEKTDRSLWTSAVTEILETSSDFVVVRTHHSVYRLRKI